MQIKSTGAGVAWTCRKCGKTGLGSDRATAGRQFDAHNCTD
jgi:tRNA(Ile2) C34 agmatinyltransferase TiaS